MARLVKGFPIQSELSGNEIAPAKQHELPQELDRLKGGAFEVNSDPVENGRSKVGHRPATDDKRGVVEGAILECEAIDLKALDSVSSALDDPQHRFSSPFASISASQLAAIEAGGVKAAFSVVVVDGARRSSSAQVAA